MLRGLYNSAILRIPLLLLRSGAHCGSRIPFCDSHKDSEKASKQRSARILRSSRAMESPGDDQIPRNGEEQEKKTEDSVDDLGPAPEKPLPGDCCGSGCERCVWDIYFDELEEYKKRKSDLESKRK